MNKIKKNNHRKYLYGSLNSSVSVVQDFNADVDDDKMVKVKFINLFSSNFRTWNFNNFRLV